MAPTRWKTVLAAGAMLALVVIVGCSGGASTSLVPKGVLPADGEPVMYEFYTDT